MFSNSTLMQTRRVGVYNSDISRNIKREKLTDGNSERAQYYTKILEMHKE
jgi:hypothetical protein